MKPWIPSLNIGMNPDDPDKLAIEAIVKKEVRIASTSKKNGRRVKEVDRRRLENSISPDAHRGFRMLCADELALSVNCPVDMAAGEYGRFSILFGQTPSYPSFLDRGSHFFGFVWLLLFFHTLPQHAPRCLKSEWTLRRFNN